VIEASRRRPELAAPAADGIGTGLSELPTRSPPVYKRICDWIEILCARGNSRLLA
jgi:hypothetical protein